MHGHTEPTTQSISSPRAKSQAFPAVYRAFPAGCRLVGDIPARREWARGMREGEVAALVSI